MKQKNSNQWAEFFGFEIVDADGWGRDGNHYPLDKPISCEDFINRAVESTIFPTDRDRYKVFESLLTFLNS